MTAYAVCSLSLISIVLFTLMIMYGHFERFPVAATTLQSLSSDSINQVWMTGAEMPTPRNHLGAAALNGKIYIVGGIAAEGATTGRVEVYDPQIDEWNTVAPLPQPIDHPSVAASDSKLYVVGGFLLDKNGKREVSDKLFIYDPQKDEWQEGESMPSARSAATAGFIDGILYVVGGDVDWESWSTNYAYDPTSNTWTEKKPMPTPRHHLASAVADEKLYVIGGRYENRTLNINLDANEVYDPKSDSWTSLEPLPTKRSGLGAATSLETGAIYVFGGESLFRDDQTADRTYDNTERYNPQTNTWTTEQPMPEGRHGFGAVTFNDKIYLIGGGPTPGGATAANEIFVTSP